MLPLKAAGKLILSEKFLPGDYAMKISVVDPREKKDSVDISQTIDFQVVP